MESLASIAAFSELVRRAGNNAARLIAILTGTETPDDVAAVMAWFQEDPLRLVTGGRLDGGAGSGQRDSKSEPASVSVDSLGDISVEKKTDELGAGPRPGLAWERFMAVLFVDPRTARSISRNERRTAR